MDPAVGRKSARNSKGGADVDKQHVEMGAMYHGETKVPDMMNLRGPAPLRSQPRTSSNQQSVSLQRNLQWRPFITPQTITILKA